MKNLSTLQVRSELQHLAVVASNLTLLLDDLACPKRECNRTALSLQKKDMLQYALKVLLDIYVFHFPAKTHSAFPRVYKVGSALKASRLSVVCTEEEEEEEEEGKKKKKERKLPTAFSNMRQ